MAAVSGEPSGINAQLMASNSKISNSDALAKLLRNPNLIRATIAEISSSVKNSKEHTNEEHLMEEKSDVIITNKSKRSREVIGNDDQQLEKQSWLTSHISNHIPSYTITKNGSNTKHTFSYGGYPVKAFFIGRTWLPSLPGVMNIIALNCRGLGNVEAVSCIKDLVRVYKPDILILIETLVNNNKISSLCYLALIIIFPLIVLVEVEVSLYFGITLLIVLF